MNLHIFGNSGQIAANGTLKQDGDNNRLFGTCRACRLWRKTWNECIHWNIEMTNIYHCMDSWSICDFLIIHEIVILSNNEFSRFGYCIDSMRLHYITLHLAMAVTLHYLITVCLRAQADLLGVEEGCTVAQRRCLLRQAVLFTYVINPIEPISLSR